MSLLALDAEPVPVTVLTGFLGSGKTTLLRHLLGHPGMDDTAVIVNEFGEVGLDHMLLETSDETTLLLDNGCLCCGLRGDLVDTLLLLLDRRERGEVPEFRRVVIETTGLADPVPVLQTFRTDPLRLSRYDLAGMACCLDAVTGPASVEGHAEAERQLALADTVIVTKGDIGDTAAALAEAGRRNPAARLREAVHGVLDPAEVLDGAPPETEFPPVHPRGHDRIVSVAVHGSAALAWDHVHRAMSDLVERHGARLLRVKGLLRIEGEDGPVGVDGVQHLFHRPRILDRWPGENPAPFLIGMGEGVTPAELQGWLLAVLQPASSGAAEETGAPLLRGVSKGRMTAGGIMV